MRPVRVCRANWPNARGGEGSTREAVCLDCERGDDPRARRRASVPTAGALVRMRLR
ncbi:hypothetical protein ACFFQF_07285 [Haladaptatus pallidirubidus]|uniref:hypothetical protein n=1 Tax=Haladaptatus pallidirubidus TaxID=1008152 RepID=UPI0035E468D4